MAEPSSAFTIPYRRVSEYEPVDVAQLRPKDSYRRLLQQRTHSIDTLVAEHGRIPEDLLKARVCPTCGSADAGHELDKDHMTLVRCRACDLVYVNPIFDEEHYRATYASQDYQRIMRDLGEASHEYRVTRFGEERVAIMSRHVRPADGTTPSYLDVGCSTGFVVEAAARRGWRAEGIDLNPSAIAFGAARGLTLSVAALEDPALSGRRFDAISLFDVLEHLPQPRPILERCRALLPPEGIVFLYVPNYDSASRLLMGGDAHFIWPTHHLNYYTPTTIVDLLRRSGFGTELVTTEGLDIVDYTWQRRELHGEDTSALDRIGDVLQFLANAGAYGKNLRVLARRAAG
jgi:2-polyprenyl-3-methyl-5-hydroxy-6-metoxy-1,4-benzoquinol methylase